MQTNQKNGTVQPDRKPLCGASGNSAGQRAKHGWSTGSQHGKQQRWSDPTLTKYKNSWRVRGKHCCPPLAKLLNPQTHRQKMDNLAWRGLEDPNRYSPQWKTNTRQTYQGQSSFRHAAYWPAKQYQGHRKLWTRNQTGRSYQTTSTTRETHDWAIQHAHLAATSRGLANKSQIFQTLPEVTCVYGIDGKCSGNITPQRLSN